MNKDFLKELGIYSEDPNVVLDKLGAKEIELLDKKDLAETNGAHDRVKEINALLKKLKTEREVARKESKSYVPKKADSIHKKDSKAEQKNQKAKEDAVYNKLIKDKAAVAAKTSPVQTPKPTQTSKSTQPTQASKPAQPTHTPQASKPAQPTHTTQASKPAQPTHTPQASKPVQSTQPTQSTQTSRYANTSSPTTYTSSFSLSYGVKFTIGMLISIIGLVYVLKGLNPVFCEEVLPQINDIFPNIPEFLIFKWNWLLAMTEPYMIQQGIFGGWLILIGYIVRGFGVEKVKRRDYRFGNRILLILSRGSIVVFYVTHFVANVIETSNLFGHGGIIQFLVVIVSILLGKALGWILYIYIG